MKIDAGALDRQIQLLTKTVTSDAFGQEADAWTVTATVYAQRLELRAADLLRQAGIETVATGRYLIRWRDGVSINMRVQLDDGSQANVIAVDEPDRRRTLVLTIQGV